MINAKFSLTYLDYVSPTGLVEEILTEMLLIEPFRFVDHLVGNDRTDHPLLDQVL